MHTYTYTSMCFQSTGSVYRTDYINLQEGESRTNSVKDRLHAVRNDGPSAHTCVLIFWPSCDEKPPQTHLGENLSMWNQEKEKDRQINPWNHNNSIRVVSVCVFVRERWSEKSQRERESCGLGSQKVCICMCEWKRWGVEKHKKELEKVLKCFMSGSTGGLNPWRWGPEQEVGD